MFMPTPPHFYSRSEECYEYYIIRESDFAVILGSIHVDS